MILSEYISSTNVFWITFDVYSITNDYEITPDRN